MALLAKNISFYRTLKEMSQEELSKLIEKPDDYITRLESLELKRIPDLFTVIKIALALGIDFDLIMSDKSLIEMVVTDNEVERYSDF